MYDTWYWMVRRPPINLSIKYFSWEGIAIGLDSTVYVSTCECTLFCPFKELLPLRHQALKHHCWHWIWLWTDWLWNFKTTLQTRFWENDDWSQRDFLVSCPWTNDEESKGLDSHWSVQMWCMVVRNSVLLISLLEIPIWCSWEKTV